MSRRGDTPGPTPGNELLFYSELNFGVDKDGKVVIWGTKYLSLISDGGIRALWADISSMSTDQAAYYDLAGSIEPDTATNTSVTFGANTWDFSNEALITPVPQRYYP